MQKIWLRSLSNQNHTRHLRYLSTRSPFCAPFLTKKREANFVHLSPLTGFLRTVKCIPESIAYVHGDEETTWGNVGKNVALFASALVNHGIQRKDVVSVMAPNNPHIFNAHFAIPGAGGVIHAINTRLDPTTIAYQLSHSESKIVLVDTEYEEVISEVKKILKNSPETESKLPLFVAIRDPVYISSLANEQIQCGGGNVWDVDFDDFVASGQEDFTLLPCIDEFSPIALSYTSGTTGNPKGVVASYRGALLNANGNLLEMNIPTIAAVAVSKERPLSYLWIVPIFHCNGWCFVWSLGISGTKSVFMRQIRADVVFSMLQKHYVGYMAGAPVTMLTMLNYPDRFKFKHKIKFWVAGSPPSPVVIKAFTNETGIQVQCCYGMTEVYGPVATYIPSKSNYDNDIDGSSVNDNEVTWQTENAVVKIAVLENPSEKGDREKDAATSVPRDGSTVGEIGFRGNVVMMGYLKNEKATEDAFRGGYLLSGDLAVSHSRERLEMKDRLKDIIISGGENVSSIEVENVLLENSLVQEVAVIAMPHEKWGEVPCAFIVRNKSGGGDSGDNEETTLMKWSRGRMPGFATPKKIIFIDELPKTITGKVRKTELRELL